MYRWKLESDYTIPFIGSAVEHEWVSVKDHKLTVRAGYAWNGCSPCFSFFGLFWISTPNGHISYRTGKPHTYYASLVHDAMYQYEIGTRGQADKIFELMLVDFPLSRLYYRMVRIFGRRW